MMRHAKKICTSLMRRKVVEAQSGVARSTLHKLSQKVDFDTLDAWVVSRLTAA